MHIYLYIYIERERDSVVFNCLIKNMLVMYVLGVLCYVVAYIMSYNIIVWYVTLYHIILYWIVL